MEFWHFMDEASLAGLRELTPSFSYTTGWAAGLLAVFGAFALFPALARVRGSRSPNARRAWWLAGAAVMSIGIWGSQNMMLLGLNLATSYAPIVWMSLAAMIPGGVAAAVAIHALAGRRLPAGWRPHIAALAMSLGMNGAHLVLMRSLHGDLTVTHSAVPIIQSLVMAYGFVLLALYVSGARSQQLSRRWLHWLAGSVFLSMAILGSNYGILAGTRFFDNPAMMSTASSTAPTFLTPLIMLSVLVVVIAYWLGSIVDDRLSGAIDAVHSSEARHRAVVETMLDAHITTDRRGVICSFNPAAENTFGWLAKDVVGKSVSMLFRPEERRNDQTWEKHQNSTERKAAQRQRYVHEYGGMHRDGTRFPIEVAVSPFEVDGEKYYSCIVRDLTERWATEMRMERMAAAMEHAGDAIAILAPDQTIQYANPQYERLTGFPRDEALGSELPLGASEDAVTAQIWSTVSRGEVWSGQVKSRRRDASVFDEELTLTPVFDARGTITSFVAVMRDVTRRLEADLERRRLAEALQHCSDAIEILDIQGRIVYVNAAYEARSGQRLADIRGSRPEALLDFGPGAENYDDMMRTVYRGGRPWAGILKLRNIQGDLCEEHVTVSPIRDSRNQITGYVVIKRPVVERDRTAVLPELRRAIAGERV